MSEDVSVLRIPALTLMGTGAVECVYHLVVTPRARVDIVVFLVGAGLQYFFGANPYLVLQAHAAQKVFSRVLRQKYFGEAAWDDKSISALEKALARLVAGKFDKLLGRSR